jgi:hypothetical protein
MREDSPRPGFKNGKSGKPGQRRSAQDYKQGNGFKPKAGVSAARGRHGAGEAGFAGPSERRMQERYAAQPDQSQGNKRSSTSAKPGQRPAGRAQRREWE